MPRKPATLNWTLRDGLDVVECIYHRVGGWRRDDWRHLAPPLAGKVQAMIWLGLTMIVIGVQGLALLAWIHATNVDDPWGT